jgi:hypothetical protein
MKETKAVTLIMMISRMGVVVAHSPVCRPSNILRLGFQALSFSGSANPQVFMA